MAICIEFVLVKFTEQGAVYRYGHCLKSKDYELEFLFRSLDMESLEGVSFSDIMIQRGEKSDFMATRVFSKVYKHYLETGAYLESGGYYA